MMFNTGKLLLVCTPRHSLCMLLLACAAMYADEPANNGSAPKFVDPVDNRPIDDTLRERFNLPDWGNNTCRLVFPYENNLALRFTDSFHYRNKVVPRFMGLGEWAGYYLVRKAENLWEGTNKGEHKLTNFNAREMTVQLRINRDKGEDHLEMSFLSEAAIRNFTHNYSDLSWDHRSKDGWWNFFTGVRPDQMWMKLTGAVDNGYWETDPVRSYVLRVRGIMQGILQRTAWIIGKPEDTYRIRIEYEEHL